jgi:hypothetical protein
MNYDDHPDREVSWNGMSIAIPDKWEAIVKGPRHLIFERVLRPYLEIRWECPPHRRLRPPSPDQIASDLIGQAIGKLPRLEAVHDTENSSPSFIIKTFSTNRAAAPDFVLLTCRKCGTVLLVRCYPENLAAAQTRSLLSTIACHHRPISTSRWRIQDLSFVLPSGFSLERYSFTFGLSSLNFASTTTELRLCRLAPASEHLRRVPLDTLFAQFCGITRQAPERIDDATLRYGSTPGTWEGLLKRLFRRKSYRWAQMKHLPEHDRILGVFLDSRRPLDAETIGLFKEQYVIVRQKKRTPAAHLDT